MPDATVMEQIVSLCKRRGFVYPASEIYGGLNGFWDYGPLGVLLKNNIRDSWWRNMVITPPIGPDGHPIDIVGLDSSIIQNPKAWVASGHVGGFSDPMRDCKSCHARFRADQLIFAQVLTTEASEQLQKAATIQEAFGSDIPVEAATSATLATIASSVGEYLARIEEEIHSAGKKLNRAELKKAELVETKTAPAGNGLALFNTPKGFITVVVHDHLHASAMQPAVLPCPNCGKLGTLTEPREFNLMLRTEVGAVDPVQAYLRPETAQGIFLNFKNVVDTTRVKVPFGIAQVGKSFRNEVTPRNYIFRSREFEQMEIEWFCHPDEAQKWFDFWKHERMRWWRSLGVGETNLRFRQHDKDELSHYAKEGVGTADIEYRYPFTAPEYGELEGIAHRTDFDLRAHEKHSGQRLDYFDQDLQVKLKEQGVADDEIKKRSRYYPHVIEPASGLTRAVLVLLCEAFTIDESRPSKMFMKFHPAMAPIKAGIFPLVNKEGMPEIAEKLYLDLRNHFTCEYDPKQAIGKRYARMDEIGTPFCVTVDGQTLQDQTVTVRERDAMTQERVSLDRIKSYLLDKLGVS